MLPPTQMSTQSKGIIALLIVSLSYVVLGVGARLMGEGFEPLTQVYVRVAVGAAMAYILFHKKISVKNILRTPKKDYLPLFLMGTVGYGLSVYLITEGVLRTTLLTTSVIYGTFPFFTYLFSLLVFKRKIDWRLVGLIGLSLWGVMMIAGKSFWPQLDGLNVGALFVLLAAATGSWYLIGRKMMSEHLNQEELTVTIMVIAAGTVLAGAIVMGEGIRLSAFSLAPVLIGLAIGATLNIIATYLDNFAFKVLDEVFASQLLLSENVFALIIGVLFYAEKVLPIEVLGAVLIVGSVYVSNQLTAKNTT